MTGSSTSRRKPVLWAPHTGGTGIADSIHGLGYVHVAMGVASDKVSEGFFQPFPAFADFVALGNDVGTGSVGMFPVWVYCGRSEIAPPLVIEAGGHASDEATLGAIWPAPEPPVCEAASGGCHGLVFPQAPFA